MATKPKPLSGPMIDTMAVLRHGVHCFYPLVNRGGSVASANGLVKRGLASVVMNGLSKGWVLTDEGQKVINAIIDERIANGIVDDDRLRKRKLP